MKNKSVLFVILLAIIIAAFAGFFASASPDGLDKTAANLNFESKAESTNALLQAYVVPLFTHPSFSTVAAGIFGIFLIVFIFHSIVHIKHVVKILLNLMKLEKKDDDVV